MKSFLLSFLLLFAWQMMPSHAELLAFREVHPTSWPDFPVIYITTVKGELPTCRVVYHQLVYGEGECRHTMRFQMDELMDKFEKRVAAMDSLVRSGIPMTEARSARLLQRMDLSGRNCTNISPAALQQSIYVDRYSDGTSRKWLKR